MEERMEDKSYKNVETSHSGFTNEPYVSTLAHLFVTPMFTWFIILKKIKSENVFLYEKFHLRREPSENKEGNLETSLLLLVRLNVNHCRGDRFHVTK